MNKQNTLDTVLKISWLILKYTCISLLVLLAAFGIPLISLAKSASKHGDGLSKRSY